MKLEIIPTEDGYRLEGELDMATADDLGELLKESGGHGDPVVLDFQGISFMDSSGLRVLLEAAGSDVGTNVVIIHPTQQVRRIFDISIPGGAPGLEVRS